MNEQSDMVTLTGDTAFWMDPADIIEVPLLLSGWQMSALERAAYLRGLTAAEMVRQVLGEFIDGQPLDVENSEPL